MGILFATNGRAGGGGTQGPAGLEWKGPWSNSTAYAVDDAVSFAGTSYVCIQAHTNQSPPNGTYWQVLASKGDAGPDAIIWRGPWSNATTYAVNDAVSLGGSSYICKQAHTNQTPPNATYWDLLAVRGDTGPAGDIRWRGAWNGATSYLVDDAVERNGSAYVAIADNTNSAPPSVNWDLLAAKGATGNTGLQGNDGDQGDQGPPGLVWRGAWNSGTSYAVSDAVSLNGNSYYCKQAHSNQSPPNATYWDLLAAKGDPGPDSILLQMTNASGGTLVFGTPVYAKGDGSGCDKAWGNAYATALVIGLVTDASVPNGGTVTVQTYGLLTGTTTQWDAVLGETGIVAGLEPGKEYFVSRSTAGKLTETSPAVLGDAIAVVGAAFTQTAFFIRAQRPVIL